MTHAATEMPVRLLVDMPDLFAFAWDLGAHSLCTGFLDVYDCHVLCSLSKLIEVIEGAVLRMVAHPGRDLEPVHGIPELLVDAARLLADLRC